MAIFLIHMFLGGMITPISFNSNYTNYLRRNNSPSFKNTQTSTQQTKPQNTLSIYYYNDTHGNSDSIAELVNSAKHFRLNHSINNSFILSAGDNCSGVDEKKNEYIFDIMQNIMGVELSAVGNHEVDGSGVGFAQSAKDKKITFVATNVDFDNDNPMKDFVKKSIIKEKDGVKYGFIGTMPIDFEQCTKKDAQKGVKVMDIDKSISALQKEVDNLKSQGVNRIILLSHVGYDTDKRFAQELDGVDIIVGGHTHVLVEGAKQNENILKSKSGEPVIITQASENGKYYGVLNVEFNDNGVLTKVQNNVTQAANREKSPVLEAIKEKKLGISPHVGTIKEVEPLPNNRRIESCGWSEIMADSMKKEIGADIAIVNSANTRKVPKAGNLTQRDIQESTPMKNNLLKTKVTQKQLVEAVKNASKRTMSAYDGYPGLLIPSGFNYKIDDLGNLLEMSIIDDNGNKTPIDILNPSDNITYSAVYDNFASKAGGEYPELEPRFNVQEYDFDKDTTLINYLSKLENKESLVIKTDGRIEIQKTSQSKPQGSSSRKI